MVDARDTIIMERICIPRVKRIFTQMIIGKSQGYGLLPKKYYIS